MFCSPLLVLSSSCEALIDCPLSPRVHRRVQCHAPVRSTFLTCCRGSLKPFSGENSLFSQKTKSLQKARGLPVSICCDGVQSPLSDSGPERSSLAFCCSALHRRMFCMFKPTMSKPSPKIVSEKCVWMQRAPLSRGQSEADAASCES